LQLASQSNLHNFLKRGESHLLDVVFDFGYIPLIRAAPHCELLLGESLLQFLAFGSASLAVLLLYKFIQRFYNPASDHITIDYGNFALMAGYTTTITDAAGATVYSSAVNSQQVEININAWGAMGVYYMSVYDANGQLVAVRHIVLE